MYSEFAPKIHLQTNLWFLQNASVLNWMNIFLYLISCPLRFATWRFIKAAKFFVKLISKEIFFFVFHINWFIVRYRLKLHLKYIFYQDLWGGGFIRKTFDTFIHSTKAYWAHTYKGLYHTLWYRDEKISFLCSIYSESIRANWNVKK